MEQNWKMIVNREKNNRIYGKLKMGFKTSVSQQLLTSRYSRPLNVKPEIKAYFFKPQARQTKHRQ